MARVAVAGIPGQLREPLLDAVKPLGCGDIAVVRDRKELLEELQLERPDLVFLSAEFDGGRAGGLVKDLRSSRLGPSVNPFATVLLTSWDREEAPVRLALETGADGVLLLPTPMNRMQSLVANFIRQRRPFIVTSDYIGPERRSDPNRRGDIPYFRVPNTLAAKISGDPDMLAAELAGIEPARRAVLEERLQREAFQLAFLAKLISETGVADPAVSKTPARMLELAQSLLDKAGAERQAALVPLVSSLRATLEQIVSGDPDVRSRLLRAIDPVARGIVLAVREDGEDADLADEIEATLERVRQRQSAVARGDLSVPGDARHLVRQAK